MASMKSQTHLTMSEAQTIEMGKIIGSSLMPGDIVILIGDLGAGKTRLAKGIVSAATGIDQDEVVSPSFSLINRYEGDMVVDHADLYRLTDQQVNDLGVYDVLDEAALIIEWGHFRESHDDRELQVVIRYAEEEDSRLIELSYACDGSWDKRLTTRLREFELIQ